MNTHTHSLTHTFMPIWHFLFFLQLKIVPFNMIFVCRTCWSGRWGNRWTETTIVFCPIKMVYYLPWTWVVFMKDNDDTLKVMDITALEPAVKIRHVLCPHKNLRLIFSWNWWWWWWWKLALWSYSPTKTGIMRLIVNAERCRSVFIWNILESLSSVSKIVVHSVITKNWICHLE